MGFAVCTLKVMPESPDVDMTALEGNVINIIKEFVGDSQIKTEIEPIAFGLNAIKILFMWNEERGSPDVAAEKVAELDFVNSSEIIDVRRALG